MIFFLPYCKLIVCLSHRLYVHPFVSLSLRLMTPARPAAVQLSSVVISPAVPTLCLDLSGGDVMRIVVAFLDFEELLIGMCLNRRFV